MCIKNKTKQTNKESNIYERQTENSFIIILISNYFEDMACVENAFSRITLVALYDQI